jgi:hypothetical protein
MKRRTAPGYAGEAVIASKLTVLCGRVGDRLLVEDPERGIIEARTTVRLTHKALAAAIEARRQAVVVMCGELAVVTGLLEPLPSHSVSECEQEELVLNSPKGVLLRCGEASIQLTPDGRVLVRGKDVLTRARRRNHVVGAAVRLN